MAEKKSLKKRTSLGKGLGALLGDSAPAKDKTVNEETTVQQVVEKLDEISVEQIERNPYQPRLEFTDEALKELADSIRVQGIIQPITVRKLNDESYQLISGERRLQASKLAGLEKIPAFIRAASDSQMLEMALIENIQREDLNPIEVALSYQRLIVECNLKQEELGDRVGKKRATVTNYLRLLKLPPEVQENLRKKKITTGHAKCLVGLENIDLQLTLCDKIIDEQLSVRKTEQLVNSIIQGKDPLNKKTKPKELPLNFELSKLQSDLTSHFGTEVKVRATGAEKGEIKIPYLSKSDLNRILELLKK